MHSAWIIIKKLTFRRFFNIVKVYINIASVYLLGKEFLYSFPLALTIEPTNNCNLKCVQCPTGLNLNKTPKGYLDYETFRQIVDSACKTIIMVQLHFRGEPFLHPDIYKMIQYAHEKKLYTSLSTNGHFIHRNEEKIIKSNLDHINIALDGMTTEVYTRYRKNGDFEKVIKGIKNLAGLKTNIKSGSPRITLQMLITKHNENQINDFMELNKIKGINKSLLKTMQIIDTQNTENILPQNKKYRRTTGNSSAILCKKTIKTAVITCNGTIIPCCYDKEEEYSITSAKNYFNIKTLGDGLHKFRAKRYKKNITPVICKNCEETAKKIYI